MIYMPRRYRQANHVGRLRTRMAALISKAFTDAGFTVKCEPADLHPSRGYWKQHAQDVMRWEGFMTIRRHGKDSKVAIASWDSMTDCARGFTVFADGFCNFEIGADDGAGKGKHVCDFQAGEYDR